MQNDKFHNLYQDALCHLSCFLFFVFFFVLSKNSDGTLLRSHPKWLYRAGKEWKISEIIPPALPVITYKTVRIWSCGITLYRTITLSPSVSINSKVLFKWKISCFISWRSMFGWLISWIRCQMYLCDDLTGQSEYCSRC